MANTTASLYEKSQAILFLRLIHARTTNLGLIAAVVAWMRVEGKAWSARAFAQRLLAGAAYSPIDLSKLSGLDARRAAAETNLARLKQSEMFQMILAAARRSDNHSGVDFLYGLALSNWDAAHFGGTADFSKNLLWKALQGIKSIANAPVKRPVQIAKQPVKHKESGVNLLPGVDYTQPYAAEAFYDARHHGIPALPGAIFPPRDGTLVA